VRETQKAGGGISPSYKIAGGSNGCRGKEGGSWCLANGIFPGVRREECVKSAMKNSRKKGRWGGGKTGGIRQKRIRGSLAAEG